MPVMMKMRWAGVTPEQYEETRKLVRWEEEIPTGAMFHVAAFDDDGLHVTDVWETAADFQRFVEERLMPGVKVLGIDGAPDVEIFPAHAIFAPAFRARTEIARAS